MTEIDSYEQKFHQIVNNILDIIVEIDLKGNFTYVSPQAYNILGYHPNELIGVNGFKFIHPEDLPRIIEEMKDLLLINKTNLVKQITMEYRTLHKKGHYIFLSARGSLVKSEGDIKIIAVLRDVTEKKEAEQKLKKTEEMFRLISENAHDLITIVDENFKREYVNKDAYFNILGYSEEDVTIKNLFELVHPDDFPEARKALLKGIESGVGFFEARVKHKKGHYIWLGVIGKMFNDKEGKRKGILISRDITQRKGIEQKLKESEEKFRTIIEIAKEGYYEVDLKGNFTFFNSALSNLIKYSPNELMGMNFKEIMNEKNRKLTFEAFNNAYRTGIEQQEFQYELINKNGENLYGESSIYLRYDSDGGVIGFSGFIRDITEKKEAEQKLKESEEKFRTITEQSVIGFLIFQDNRIIYLNNTVTNIVGYSFEELNNISTVDFFNFIHPEDRSILASRLKKKEGAVNGEVKIRSKPFRVITKSGEIRWVDVYTQMFKLQEKNTIFATIVDVTKEKMAEEELQKLNELKSEFLRRASHELKTPLISIKGFTNLVLKRYGETLDNEGISMLEEVVLGCHRLEDIIKNLIEATKIESSKLDLKTSIEDLAFLIRFCLNELRGLAKSRNHAIHIKIDEKIITKFNKEQMYEVITNLLSNAIKYTPPTGEIIIKSEIKDSNVIISIQDNGIGFTIKEKEKVFQQFGKIERYGQGLDIGIDGSGLGLYLSKEIVKLHGGNIWMESEGKNKGSIFYVSLPLIKN